MSTITEGTLLWQPPDELKRQSRLQAYIDWLAEHRAWVDVFHLSSYSPEPESG